MENSKKLRARRCVSFILPFFLSVRLRFVKGFFLLRPVVLPDFSCAGFDRSLRTVHCPRPFHFPLVFSAAICYDEEKEQSERRKQDEKTDFTVARRFAAAFVRLGGLCHWL
jgi:hypothetical protein